MKKTLETIEQKVYKGMRVTLFVFLIAKSMVLIAKPVSTELARRVAANWIGNEAKVGSEDVRIVYTHMDVQTGIEAFYAVNVGNHAFVLVAADNVARPVLGYSTTREFIVENIPAHVLWFYDDLASQIGEAVTKGVEQDQETATMWRQLSFEDVALCENPDGSLYTSLADSVGPLLSTTWSQGLYYNDLCPVDSAGPNGHVYTGCVATAVAQIVKYWEYPLQGRGMYSYYHAGHGALYNYGVLSVNYDSTTYDYSLMPSNLDNSSTPQEITAVATLMRDCGVAMRTYFGPYGSSASINEASIGLVNFFQYGPDQRSIDKDDFTYVDWDSTLRAEIDEGCPVLYRGVDDNTYDGHAFVCDGYKQDGFFHFNIGWGGWCDGWYLSSVVNPSQYQFNSNQAAIIDIVPDSTSNVIFAGLSGISTFRVEQPLEFRGSSTFLPDTIVFIPTEDTMQLEVNYIPGEETNWWLNAQIYDGVGTDLLIGTITGGAITYPPMVTQAHLMTMVFSGTFLEDYLLISEYTGCTHQINVSANPSNGGSVQGGGTYNSGANCTVTATPNSNYSFVNWTENGTPVSSNTSYSFIVNDDRTLTANFQYQQPSTYTITVSANPSDGGTVYGGGDYSSGITCHLIAVPNNNYLFLNWTENGVIVSSDSDYSFVVTGNRTLTANFIFNNGINELEDAVSVYPNPTSNIVYIEGNHLRKIEVYNAMGMLVMSETISDSHTELDLQHLSAGIYCLRIYSEDGAFSQSVVKE